MEDEVIMNKADPSSHLPYTIIHNILSLLDSREMISRMSVLSKDWFAVTASYPILKFRYDLHRNTRAKFFKYVDYTTTTFSKQHGDAHIFSIVSPRLEPAQVDILDRCLGLILKKGLQVLEIITYANQNRAMYRLPDIILSASSLTSMTLQGCELPLSVTVDVFKFTYLKLLSFRRLPLDEGVIKCLTSGCPVLEEIILDCCRGDKSIGISGPQNLKKVEIYGASFYERVDIEAPNLCHILLLDDVEPDEVEWGPPLMNLASCKKLKTFCYNGLGVNRFLSNFPIIENLSFYLPSDCDNLVLAIHSLKRLALHSYCDLDKIDIDTPNLLWFEYNCASSKNPFLKKDPTEQGAYIKYHSSEQVNALWFQKFSLFWEKSNIFKVLKLVNNFTYGYIDQNALNALDEIQMSPYELEHVELDAINIQSIFLEYFYSVVNAILGCFYPRSLSLSFVSISRDSHFRTVKDVARYACEKLLQHVDESRIKIQIMVFYSSGFKLHFNDLRSLLVALPHDRLLQTITFTKEEVIQEHDNGTVNGM